jgi:hypothetical protein
MIEELNREFEDAKVQADRIKKSAWIYCDEGEVTLAIRALIVGLRG